MSETKPIPRKLLAVATFILVLIIVWVAWGRSLLLSFAVYEATKDTAQTNTLRTAVSATPLFCSLDLSQTEKASLDLLIQAYSFTKEKYAECGGSAAMLDKCLDRYATDLARDAVRDVAKNDDLGTGILDAIGNIWNGGVKKVRKAKALYGAERQIRKSLRRAIARVKMIETFDQTDEEAKQSVLSFLQYIDGVGVTDIIFGNDDVRTELGQRFSKAKSDVLEWTATVKNNFTAVVLYLFSLDDKAAMEFFGEPKIAAIVSESPVWEADFNKACTPDRIIRDVHNTLKATTELVAQFDKL